MHPGAARGYDLLYGGHVVHPGTARGYDLLYGGHVVHPGTARGYDVLYGGHGASSSNSILKLMAVGGFTPAAACITPKHRG